MSEDLTYEIYWTKDSSGDDDLPLVQVPGVDDVGNKRPSVKMRARRTREVKAVVPPKSPVIVEDLSPSKRKPLRSINKRKDEVETKEDDIMKTRHKPALKDLRPEDKKRVANLIRELARIGEEKENAVEQLQFERSNFEERTKRLREQYSNIIKEREDLQNQYIDCQKMLASYQTQIAGQQERMSQTLSELMGSPKRNGVSEMLTSLPLPEPGEDNRTRRQDNFLYSSPGRHRPQPMPTHQSGGVHVPRLPDTELGENGMMRFQRDFQDDFKPALASTDRSYDTYCRSEDYNFPKLDAKDLYSENQYSVRSELNDHYSSRPYQQQHHGYRGEYVANDWKKTNDLTPPDTYESRTPGGDFKPLSPVASEQDSETSEEYKKSTEILNESYNRAKRELRKQNYKKQVAVENNKNVPLDSYRSVPAPTMQTGNVYPPYHGHNPQPIIPAYPGTNSQPVIPVYPVVSNGHHMVPGNQEPVIHSEPEINMDGKQTAAALLSPELRKQQLLIQREQLRLEQLRLKQKLKDQESQLNRKKEELKQQQDLHEDRLRYFELHGKFPPYFSEYTPKTPTYKDKFSSSSSQDSRDEPISTNYPPLDLQERSTPLRRLDRVDEDIVNSINAKDTMYHHSREEDNSYKHIDLSQLGSPSRHHHGDTSIDRNTRHVSPGQYSANGSYRDASIVTTPKYELDTRRTADIGTSPLYMDRSMGTSPYRSPSQHISPLPDTRYVPQSHTSPLERPDSLLSARQQYNRPADVNGYRISPSRSSGVNGYGTTLTDIVDTIERTSIGHDKTRQQSAKTPELFSSSGIGDSSYSDQENDLIEDVFFLK